MSGSQDQSGRPALPGLRTALRLLLPLGRWPEADATVWRRSAPWLVPVGLVIGLVWAGAFRLSWRIFGEVDGLRPMPALLVVVLDVVLLGYRQYWGILAVAGRWSASPGDPDDPAKAAVRDADQPSVFPLLVLGLAVFSLWVLLLSVPNRPGYWPAGWRALLGINELFPRPIFRPLILAPLWGRWAMLMAANVGRVAPDSAARGFCAAVKPALVLVSFVPVALITAAYCGRLGNRLGGVMIGLVVLGATHLISTVFGRRLGGQSFATIFATSKAAEFTFLLAYLAAMTRL